MKTIKMIFQLLMLFSFGGFLMRYLNTRYNIPHEIGFGAFLALVVAPLAWSVSSSWSAIIFRSNDSESCHLVFKNKSFWENSTKNFNLGQGSRALSADSQLLLPGGQRVTGKVLRLVSPSEKEHFEIPLTFSSDSAIQKVDEINAFLASHSGEALRITEGGEGLVGPVAIMFVAAFIMVAACL